MPFDPNWRPAPSHPKAARHRPAGTSAPGPKADRPPGWPAAAGGAALAAAAIAAYSGTFSVPFLFDDDASIAGNPTIRHLGTAFWPPANRTVTGRPILNLSLAVNYALSGTAVWSYHALNLAIHILAGLVLFGIVRRTLGPRGYSAPTALAFSTALLWTLHPLQTQAVTYIAQRAESLMGLFYLLTLYCFIRGAGTDDPRGSPWLALSVASCLLGMATKEVMASAPLIVLLYDRTFVAGSFREAFRRRWRVHGAMAATWLVLAFLVLSAHRREGGAGSVAAAAWWRYALTQLPAIAHYLRLCFWPYPLVFDYGTALSAPSLQILPSALLVAGLAAATLLALIRRPAAGFLGASFFAILAPSSSLVPVAGETMADYRMYLPLIPVAVLVVLEVDRRLGRAAPALWLILAAALGLATARRNRDYSSEQAIWSDTVAKRPGNYRARNNLGLLLSKVPGGLDGAVEQYREALRLNPGSAEEHINLGDALLNVPGRLDEAIAQFEEARRLEPALYGAYIGMGNALSRVPGRLDEAIAQFGEALRLKPDSAEGHFNLGNALSRAPGRLDEAIAQYEEALRLRPAYARAHFGLAVALLGLGGRTAEARAHLEAGLRLQPGDAQARQILDGIRGPGP